MKSIGNIQYKPWMWIPVMVYAKVYAWFSVYIVERKLSELLKIKFEILLLNIKIAYWGVANKYFAYKLRKLRKLQKTIVK